MIYISLDNMKYVVKKLRALIDSKSDSQHTHHLHDLNGVETTGTGENVLSDTGRYVRMTALSQENEDKLKRLKVDTSGVYYLSDVTNNTYTPLAIINDNVNQESTSQTYSNLYIKSLLNEKADNTSLHSHSNKDVLDGITKEQVTKWDGKTAVIDLQGDGELFLSSDGTYKRPVGTGNIIDDTQIVTDLTYSSDKIESLVTSTCSDLANDVDAKLATKIDAVLGKGLSANDYTDEEKEKVSHIVTNGSYDLFLSQDGSYYQMRNFGIDDNQSSTNTTYSSSKIDEKLDKEIKNLVLPTQNDAPTLWQKTFDNVNAGDVLEMSTSLNYKLTKAIIQPFKFVSGNVSVDGAVATFNYDNSHLFNCDLDRVSFEYDHVKLKNLHEVDVHDSTNGYYETDTISKADFIDITGIVARERI